MSDVAPRHSGVDDYTVPSTKPDEMLLPLLQPKEGTLHASAPPLHNLPNSQLSGRRIAWRTKAGAQSSSSSSSSSSHDVDWITTTHTYPAAYPRTHAHCTTPSSQPYRRPVALPAPALASAEAEKAYDRGKRAEDGQFWRDEMRVLNDVARYFPPKSKIEGLRRAQEARERMEPQLWCTAQRIIPVRHYPEEQNARSASASAGPGKKKKEPVTLLLMHATGFHKEIYEPFLQQLTQLIADGGLDAAGEVEVEEIWSLDVIISGESAILNKDTLGEAVHWADSARDIIQLVTNYMPPLPHQSGPSTSSASTQHLWPPTVLSRAAGPNQITSPSHRSSPATSARPSHPNTRGRRIIGIGHSYSGAAIATVANTYPGIFERIILLDPIMLPVKFMELSAAAAAAASGRDQADAGEERPPPMAEVRKQPLAMGASVRKDVWRDQATAEQSFRSKPFFQAWHPSVLDLHLQYGLTPLQGTDRQVTLTMPKFLEASSFASSWLSSYAYAAVNSGAYKRHYEQDERRRGKMHIVVMAGGNRVFDYENLRPLIGEGPGKKLRGSVDVMLGGHLVAQEQPHNLARAVLSYLRDQPFPRDLDDEAQAKAHL